MKSKVVFKFLKIMIFIVSGTVITSCTHRGGISLDQKQRLRFYIHSENEFIAGMFFEENVLSRGVQPALTHKEVDILDALADRIDPEVRKGFDQRYSTWLYCWAPLDSLPLYDETTRLYLKCNGKEFQELIEFCRQQDDEIFLLLYQLAARAQCPYDQYLLQPAYELLENFPEFSQYWRDVDLSLQREKPDLKNRTCNESTIWYTRKFLETRYGYTYANELTNLFDTRKIL
jgi:hypothetical protein